MEQVLTINPNKLVDLIRESVHEAFEPKNSFELSDDFSIMVDRLKEMAWQLEGFVGEYKNFIESMQKVTQQMGLQLADSSSTDSFDMDDLSHGTTAEFQFEYILPGYDVQTMSDDEYEILEEKLSNICTEVEIEINPRGFKFGQVRIYQSECGIEIYYEFNFWQ